MKNILKWLFLFGLGVVSIAWFSNASMMCTKDYSPVCGEVEVQCITAPCNPIKQTFWNMCMLEWQWAKLLYKGECWSPIEDTDKELVEFPSSVQPDFDILDSKFKEWLSNRVDLLTKKLFNKDLLEWRKTIKKLSDFVYDMIWKIGQSVYLTAVDEMLDEKKYLLKLQYLDSLLQSKIDLPVACDMSYMPVCWLPPVARCEAPIWMVCSIAAPQPTTYWNSCSMKAAFAEKLYDWECK